jgi:hypothetical protein
MPEMRPTANAGCVAVTAPSLWDDVPTARGITTDGTGATLTVSPPGPFTGSLTFSHKTPDPGPPLARATDPATSHEAAEDVRPRRKSRKALLLAVFRAYGALTAEQACALAGLEVGGWKRCSELVGEGKLRRTGETRQNLSGSDADVLMAVPDTP